VLRLDPAAAKRVAHAHGGKVNDIVLDLVAGGLPALLRSRGEPVEGLSQHAAVAVSLRTAGQAAEAGNRVGDVVVRLTLSEPDPGARLRLVCADSADAKQSPLPTTGNGLLVWCARLGLMRPFIRRQRLINLVESNVIGPPTPIRVLGAPVLDLVPIGVLAGNVAISFLALSYSGSLIVNARADADRYPDLPVLLAAMERDWRTIASRTPLIQTDSSAGRVAAHTHPSTLS
jgi:diacylglycerol O-acyltransferase / wax synthase